MARFLFWLAIASALFALITHIADGNQRGIVVCSVLTATSLMLAVWLEWRIAKEKYSQEYRRGRTTNEVLFEAGELEAFELAGRARNAKKMAAALMRSGVPRDEAKEIVETTLSAPEAYGF